MEGMSQPSRSSSSSASSQRRPRLRSQEMSHRRCRCGDPPVLRISQTVNNPNREFWTCPQLRGGQCDFFAWVQEGELVAHDEEWRNTLMMKLTEMEEAIVRLKSEIYREVCQGSGEVMQDRVIELQMQMQSVMKKICMENQRQVEQLKMILLAQSFFILFSVMGIVVMLMKM